MKIQKNIKLARYTTFHIGGPAEFFAEANGIKDLKKAINFAKKNKLKIFVLGGGSNILLPDNGIKGLVLRMHIRGLTFKDNMVYAGAGEKWDKVVAMAVSGNLGGIENLSLIPGTVGGAVYQNIGAYGTELKDILESVEVFDQITGKVKKLSVKECHFEYRNSIFQNQKGNRYIILKAGLRLSKKPIPKVIYPDLIKYFEGKKGLMIKDMRIAIIKIRKSKLDYPDVNIGTAGSFFKNPIITLFSFKSLVSKHPDLKGRDIGGGLIKLFAGQLTEKAGWKGKRLGSAGVSKRHAMVLISYKGAESKDIIKLYKLIQKSVKDKFGILLEPEVKIVL